MASSFGNYANRNMSLHGSKVAITVIWSSIQSILHISRSLSTVEESPFRKSTSRRSIDELEPVQRSTGCIDTPWKSIDRREKPRKSTHRPENLKFQEFKFGKVAEMVKFRVSFDRMERSRRSVNYHEKSRSIDQQLERARKSLDWLDRIHAG